MNQINLPTWLSMPLQLATFLMAVLGTIAMFLAATRGEYGPAVWGILAFAASGALWFVADIAATENE